MIRVVAIEGKAQLDAPLYWGAAAIDDGTRIINSVTRNAYDRAQLDELVEDEAVTLLVRPLPIDPDWQLEQLILLLIPDGSRWVDLLVADKGRHGGLLVKKRITNTWHYLFRDHQALLLYSTDIIERILKKIFAARRHTAEDIESIGVGLLLDPAHPRLNALRVHFSNSNRALTARLARANVRGTEAENQFDDMLQALEHDGKTYRLKYEDGIAEGGGLDVSDASKVLKSIGNASPKLQAEIARDYTFLPPSPTPRLRELHAHSAELVFAPDIKDRSLGERVMRYLELRLLERVLNGDAPDDLELDSSFESTIDTIVRPTPDTLLSQKPLESSALRRVEVAEITPAPQGEIRSATIEMFCIHTGVSNDSTRIELRVAPGRTGRIRVSALTNGAGEPPAGLLFLSDKRVSLYQLYIASLQREWDPDGRERYYLLELRKPRDRSEVSIEALPSAVVGGAICKARVSIAIDDGRIVVDGHEAAERYIATLAATNKLLATLQKIFHDIELDPRRHGGWIPPARAPEPSSLDRVLLTLHRLGGEANANLLADTITRTFNLQVRINNTRREVYLHPDLVTLADDKTMRLTPKGVLHVHAYLAIMQTVDVPSP